MLWWGAGLQCYFVQTLHSSLVMWHRLVHPLHSSLVMWHRLELCRLTTALFVMAHFDRETNLKFRQALAATHAELTSDPADQSLSSFNGNQTCLFVVATDLNKPIGVSLYKHTKGSRCSHDEVSAKH